MNDFSFQDEAAKHHAELLRTRRFSVDLSGTGSGKSYIAAKTAALLSEHNCAVICPLSVIEKFKKVFLEVAGIAPLFVANREAIKAGKIPYFTKHTKVGRQKASYLYRCTLPLETLVIVDEAHEDTTLGTQNTAIFSSLSQYKTLALSATLAHTPLRLMGPIGMRLGLHNGFNAHEWACSMGCRPSFFGRGKALEWTKDPESREIYMKMLHGHILPSRGYRAPDQVNGEFPAYIGADCLDFGISFSPIVEEALEKVDELEEADLVRAEESESGGSHLTSRVRENMREELHKADWLAAKANQIVEEGGSFVAFVNFHQTADVLQALLKGKAGLYTGKIQPVLRQWNLEQFQKNESKILIATVGAGSQSIDLHDTLGNSPRHVYLCPNDNPVKLLQALGRVDRLGRKSRCFQTILYSARSVEAKIYKNVVGKMNCLHTLNRGDLDPTLN